MGCLLSHFSILVTIKNFTNYTTATGVDIVESKETGNDSTPVPGCIKKLSGPGKKGIRSYSGGLQYTGIYKLNNGKHLYAFRNEASNGCNLNEPAGNKYYNDSCKLVAKFPGKFSIKHGFKPFIAAGYVPADFVETTKGDYPLYFENLERSTTEKNKTTAVKDPFPTERSFTIAKVENDLLYFKTGDVIKIHTKTGLWHFRNKKLLTQYKIVPQLAIIKQIVICKQAPCPTVETKQLVYFMGASERFIDIRNNALVVSATKQKDANTPTTAIDISWQRAYRLKP